MASVEVRERLEFESPTLVEGLPGIGLVGKIAADHLVEEFDMTFFARVVCDGLPPIAVYQQGDPTVTPPVRLYGDAERDLLVLQSDVPVSPSVSSDFASCVVGWLAENDVTPLFLSGLPNEKSGERPSLYAVAAGGGTKLLSEHDINDPSESGVVAGPTGALLHRADQSDLTAVGLVVESDPQFPDPEAAHVLIEDAIEPLAGIAVDTDDLVDRAEEIREQKERLAKRMQEAGEESSRAEPLRMYQ